MDYKDIALEVGKSVSTIKRWKKRIEELTKYEFEEVSVQIGRGRNYQKIPDFDEDECHDFKEMSPLIEKKGLDKAIVTVWGFERELNLESLYKIHSTLSRSFIKYKKSTTEQFKVIDNENQTLRSQLITANKNISDLTERIENLEKRGLKNIFNKK